MVTRTRCWPTMVRNFMGVIHDDSRHDHVQRLLRYRWLIFAVVSGNGVLLYFHYAWGATLSGYHTVDWKLDAGQLGLLAASGFFSYALMQIPGGYLTDLLGVRKAMSIS